MDTQISLEEIIHLLDSGFKPDIIAFEFDLSEEYIIECQRLLEKKRLQTQNQSEKDTAHAKVKNMRKMYKALCSEDKTSSTTKTITQTDEQASKIDSIIFTIQDSINQMPNMPTKDKQKTAIDLLNDLKQINDYPLTVEQAEKIYTLLSTDILHHIRFGPESQIPFRIQQAQRKYCKEFANAISIQMEQAQTLEELTALNSKLTLKITQFDPVGCGSVKYKLNNKISRFQQSAISKNTMPTEIIDIIKNISQVRFDVDAALETISQQAIKNIDGKPQTRFALTLEQAVEQILIKIQSSLIDKADTFPITNPKQAIENLCRLNNNNPETAVGTVVKNLCARQEFETAKQICSHYAAEYKGTSKMQYVRDLSREVSVREITAFTQKHLNSDTSKEEDEVFIGHLERELKSKGIKKSAILLRKGTGSTKPITLDDISKSKENEKDR